MDVTQIMPSVQRPRFTLEISASKDTYIKKDSPTANYGSGIQFSASDDGIAGGTQRGIISFSLSTLPSIPVLQSASLVLSYTAKTGSPEGKTAYLYKLTQPTWAETEATWDIYETGSNWTLVGGDFTSSPTPAEATIPAFGVIPITWDVQALVQDAIDNSLDLHLMLRIQDDTGSDGDQIVVGSRTQSDPYKPLLTIVTY